MNNKRCFSLCLSLSRSQMELGCCLYHGFEKCALNVASQLCGSAAGEFIDNYLQQTARETVDLLCSTDPSICSTADSIRPNKDIDIDKDGPQNVFEAVYFILKRVQTRG